MATKAKRHWFWRCIIVMPPTLVGEEKREFNESAARAAKLTFRSGIGLTVLGLVVLLFGETFQWFPLLFFGPCGTVIGFYLYRKHARYLSDNREK